MRIAYLDNKNIEATLIIIRIPISKQFSICNKMMWHKIFETCNKIKDGMPNI